MERANEQNNEINPRLDSVTGGGAFSAATVAYIVAALIAGFIISAAALEEGSDGYVYISYLAAPVALAASVALTLKFWKVSLRDVTPLKCKPKYFLIGAMLIFGLLFSLNWLSEAAVKFFELFGYQRREASSYFPTLTNGLVLPALLVVALLPAVFEELLFRGVILNACERSMGSIRTVFIVGFCFSLFHASPEQTVYQFVAGCVFAFVAVRSRSILPSVMMHFINNALIIIFAACHFLDESGALALSSGANIALTVLGACCLVGGLAWLVLDKTPLVKGKKGGVKNFFLYASVGIVILAVVWICSLIGVQ